MNNSPINREFMVYNNLICNKTEDFCCICGKHLCETNIPEMHQKINIYLNNYYMMYFYEHFKNIHPFEFSILTNKYELPKRPHK